MTSARTVGEVFRDRLRTVRERKRWKQFQLAERVTEMGAPMHQTAIAKIENGERKVTLDDAMRLAAALDVSPLSLILPLGDEDAMSLAPRAEPMPAKLVRAWIDGTLPVTAVLYAAEGLETEYRTLDGLVLDEAEALERRRFYASEESSGRWKMSQVPGLAHLRAAVEGYSGACAADASAGARRAKLALIEAEVARQVAALDTEEMD